MYNKSGNAYLSGKSNSTKNFNPPEYSFGLKKGKRFLDFMHHVISTPSSNKANKAVEAKRYSYQNSNSTGPLSSVSNISDAQQSITNYFSTSSSLGGTK